MNMNSTMKLSKYTLQSIIDSLPDATFVVDREKKVIAWNRAIEHMSGVLKNEILGKGEYAYTVPFYGEARPNLIDIVFDAEHDVCKKYEYVTRIGDTYYAEVYVPKVYGGKGAFVWATASMLLDEAGTVIGAIESIRDITERRAFSEQLKLSEERFSKAFYASPFSIAVINVADVHFIQVNDNFLSVTGYTEDEIIGRTPMELKILTEPFLNEIRSSILVEQLRLYNKECSFFTKSGEKRIGLFSTELIDYGGETCILASMNDISENRKIESELQRLDRLDIIGQMAASIGHEIRNPLTTVRGFLQLLGTKNKDNDTTEYYSLMIEELDRANSIITEFLALAQNKTVDFQIKNLNDVIDSICPLISATALNNEQELVINKASIPAIPLDEKEIRQLIHNLVRNGMEASTAGQSVTIQTYTQDDDVVFSVQDCGHGIPSDILDKIGVPFLTTKEKGTGLGLAVCYSIAKRHNAEINIDTSELGTTFYVRFKPMNMSWDW